MPDWLQIILTVLGGTGGSAVIVQWLRGRSAARVGDAAASARLQEHWTDTTIELVETLQSQLRTALVELADLRPVLAHLNEALDHLHALLAASKSDNPLERSAAERRANAFLRRMRGDETRGAARQAVQTAISARRVVKDAETGEI